MVSSAAPPSASSAARVSLRIKRVAAQKSGSCKCQSADGAAAVRADTTLTISAPSGFLLGFSVVVASRFAFRSEARAPPSHAKCPFLVCFLWFPPPRQVLISYKSSSVSELLISVEHILILINVHTHSLDDLQLMWVVDLLSRSTAVFVLTLILGKVVWFTCSGCSQSRANQGFSRKQG